jgi:hypothetical protein
MKNIIFKKYNNIYKNYYNIIKKSLNNFYIFNDIGLLNINIKIKFINEIKELGYLNLKIEEDKQSIEYYIKIELNKKLNIFEKFDYNNKLKNIEFKIIKFNEIENELINKIIYDIF